MVHNGGQIIIMMGVNQKNNKNSKKVLAANCALYCRMIYVLVASVYIEYIDLSKE